MVLEVAPVFAAPTAFSSSNQRPVCREENRVIEFTNWFCITRYFKILILQLSNLTTFTGNDEVLDCPGRNINT